VIHRRRAPDTSIPLVVRGVEAAVSGVVEYGAVRVPEIEAMAGRGLDPQLLVRNGAAAIAARLKG
jgi:hypothetical protein